MIVAFWYVRCPMLKGASAVVVQPVLPSKVNRLVTRPCTAVPRLNEATLLAPDPPSLLLMVM